MPCSSPRDPAWPGNWSGTSGSPGGVAFGGGNLVGDSLALVRALIADQPAAEGSLGVTEAYLHRLSTAAVQCMQLSGAAISVLTGSGSLDLLIASDDDSKEIAELQVMLGEGPSRDAYESRRPVLEPDLGDSTAGRRWPAFAPAARALSVEADFALPLQVGAARLGVLDLYRAAPGSLSPGLLVLALTFADDAVATLLGANEHLDGSVPDGFERASADLSTQYQAQGMVMVQLGVGVEDATARLRAHAYAVDRRLADVADDVVARRLRLDRDEPQSMDDALR